MVNLEIIEAYWDEENLGLKSFEIILSSSDSVEEFFQEEKKLIEESGAKYIVVKTPVNVTDFLFELPKRDYIFLEASLKLILKKANYDCPSYISRIDKNVEVKLVDSPDDYERIYSEISKGIFKTDRIAIDRNFNQETSNKRYVNWISNIIKKGALLHEVYLDNKPLGFFILDPIDDNKIHGILTGLYEEYETSGYGILIMKKLNDVVWESGYKVYSAQVVSNNMKALRANLLFGSEVKNITYNYVKSI